MNEPFAIVENSQRACLVLVDEDGDSLIVPTQETSLVIANVGTPGPAGADGQGAPARFDFSNSASWMASHGLGRIPVILSYLSDGSQLLADVTATDQNFTVVHGNAQSGFVLVF